MLRHKKYAHSDEESEDDAMSDISEHEDIFGPVDAEETEGSSENESEHSEQFDPWQVIVDEAFDKCQPQYQNDVEKLMEDSNTSEIEAREKVFETMRKTFRKAMMNSFGSKLVWFDAMKKDRTYKSIKQTVNQLSDKESYEPAEALKYGIIKRRFLFDKILDEYIAPEVPQDMEEEVDSS